MNNSDTDRGSVEKRLEVLEAREAIRDVLYRYTRGADRLDIDLFKSCYHPDAVDLHWFWNGNAHEYADWVFPLLKQLHGSQHSITNPIIEFDGDRAFVESQWYVVHRVPLDETRLVDQQVEGRYLDIFERRDGEWKILRRQTLADAFREHVLEYDMITRYPDGHPSLGRRYPDDLVYKGFSLIDDPVEPADGVDLWAAVRKRHGVSADA
ncbi:hypothetical protein CH267_00510 [Rhodococcus sp. 06-621-2]|nr:hypothetical protein CH267_00510 [Rhodococcus sp. 06-621-2]